MVKTPKNYYYRALSTKVLVVAVVDKTLNEWTAYIDAVEGFSHKNEFMEVAKRGSKIDKKIAEIIFPTLGKYHWRW